MAKIEEYNISIPLINNETIILESNKQRKKHFFLSRIFFCQVYPLLQRATKEPLQADMIQDLDEDNKSESFFRKFQDNFARYRENKRALLYSLLSTFKAQLIITFLVLFVQISLDMIVPLLIRDVINYISSDPKQERNVDQGVRLVVYIFLTRFFSTILSQHNGLQLWTIGTDAYSAISMALMDKCLKVSLSSNKQHKSGEVMNLLQVDTRKVQWVAFQLRGIVFMPVQIGIALYLMFRFIGVSFTAGLTVIILTSMFNLKVGQYLQKNQKELMKAKDKRTKGANELFSLIKFIKINALEEFFISKLNTLRESEIAILRSRFLLNGLAIMSVWLSPVLVINATFAMFILLGNTLDAANAFAMIGLFQVLQGPLIALPMIINSIIETLISISRIQKFLLTNEIMTDCIMHEQMSFYQKESAIQIEQGNFYWNRQGEKESTEERKIIPTNNNKIERDKIKQSTIIRSGSVVISSDLLKQQQQTEEQSFMPTKIIDIDQPEEEPYVPILKDININIKIGQFVAIVGDVGSGKSSLLSSLIGDMVYLPGEQQPIIKISGRIAYVSQKTWIQNATVKDNILFGQAFNEAKYNDALKYSCFTQDLDVLVNGDQTMIGEKGVNLSGGQKARVSLARAIYSDSDIYLLDDPISAVDVHVGKFIMHKCLNGLLKDKTRILVTHALNYTQFADQIYLMENGSIIEQGKFEYIRTSPKFQKIYEKFYKKSSQPQKDEEKPDQEETKEIEEAQLDLQLKKQLSSQKTQDKPPIDTTTDSATKSDDIIDKLMLEEDRTKGTVSNETYIQYFKMTGGWSFFLLIAFIQFAWIFCRIGSSLWLAYWTDQKGGNSNFYLGIYSAFTLFFGLFAYLRIVLISLKNIDFSQKIHNQMVNCLSYAPQCQFFERVPLGRLLNRFTKDQQVLDNEINWNISSLYINIALLLSNTFMNVYGSTIYMIIPIILFFVFAWYLQRFYMHANRELYRLESISKSPILSFFGESLAGLAVIRAFGKSEQFLMKHATNMDENRKIFMEQILVSQWFNLTLSLFSFIVNMSAIIFCLFYSNKNPAFAGLLMTYAASLDQNINATISSLASFETSIISLERCLHYTQVLPEGGYTDLVKNKIEGTQYDEKIKYIDNWPSQGMIEYKNYSVQYRAGLPNALSNITFKIEARDKIGVVGRTGAGKSTITLTLLRLLEALEGKILIDGIEISQLSLQQLRESITMIMQDATIFEGTLRDNIDPMKLYTDEQVQNVLEQCCLRDLGVKRDGLNSQISENGENLSAGEKQLICIARAVLKKSQIVLIDEATANIDIETENLIQETIQKGFKDCTVITIAHRINTILHCDKILVVDKGGVKEFGSTKDLLNDKNSTFYAIFLEVQKEQQNN